MAEMLTLVGAGSEEYELHIDALGAGQSVNAPVMRFTTPRGGRYNPQHGAPRTLIVTAEIGAGGPTGVYAARL
jgi:hypothetical protein